MDNDTYNKNFLSKVIFRIDAPTMLSVQDKIKDFQTKIVGTFPILEPVEQKGVAISTNADGEVAVEHPVKTNWNFKSKDRKLECNIDEASLVVISSKYVNYSEYKEMLSLVLTAFYEVYGEVVPKRIGFRYINEISLPAEISIADCFSSWLYRDDSFLAEGHSKLRGMSKFEMAIPDSSRMNFSFGVFNAAYPEPASDKEFILDYDCYTTEPIENQDDLISLLDSYNTTMTEYFEKSITDTLRDYLNQE